MVNSRRPVSSTSSTFACVKPKSSATLSRTAPSSCSRSPAWFSRDDSRCRTHSSPRCSDGTAVIAGDISGSPAAAFASPGSSGNRCSVTWSTPSTSNTSHASSRKIPVMPVCDAIASMRDVIRSNIGPDVSERAKRSCSA